MAIEQVREYFRKAGIEERIQEFEVSSATAVSYTHLRAHET